LPACGLLVALLLAWTSPTRAQNTVHVSVDATAPGAPLERVWRYFGYDEINYTTAPEGRALLSALAAMSSAPTYARSHFLFNTGDGAPAMKWGSTNVYGEDASGNPVYNWGLTDEILDALAAAGAFPFVELGFMPEALSTRPIPYRNSSTALLDGGCFYPPADYAKWAAFIRAWAAHANERYPGVATWLWELWNEPDIGYWKGTFAEYATLYDYTESALHEVLPNASLGGPAVAGAGGLFLKQFLEHCVAGTNAVTGKVGTRLDLVTFHAKGGVAALADRIQMDLGNQLRLHRAGFNAVAKYPELEQTPIYITEADPDGCAACPASSVPADAYRFSTAYGAYELAMMKRSLELAAQLGVRLSGVLTWAFTFPGTPFFAGYRELASHGVSLPVLSAFKLLARLEGARLPLTSDGALALDDVLTNGVRTEPDVDGMAALHGDTLRVLSWNYHDDLVPATPTRVHLAIQVPASHGAFVRVSHLRVDATHGDAYAAWVSQGKPADPSAEQVAALKQAMDPSRLVSDSTIPVAADGSVQLDFELPRFGVSLVELRPAAGVTPQPAQATDGCACRMGGLRPDAARGMLPLVALALLGSVRRGRARAACRNDGS
jgi:xylan 1,4-beta-xylosidase